MNRAGGEGSGALAPAAALRPRLGLGGQKGGVAAGGGVGSGTGGGEPPLPVATKRTGSEDAEGWLANSALPSQPQATTQTRTVSPCAPNTVAFGSQTYATIEPETLAHLADRQNVPEVNRVEATAEEA